MGMAALMEIEELNTEHSIITKNLFLQNLIEHNTCYVIWNNDTSD